MSESESPAVELPLLATLILRPALRAGLLERLSPAMFADVNRRRAVEAVVELSGTGAAITPASVAASLNGRSNGAISQISAFLPQPDAVDDLAKRLRQLWGQRLVSETLRATLSEVEGKDPSESVQAATEALIALQGQLSETRTEIVGGEEIAAELWRRWQNPERALTGLPAPIAPGYLPHFCGGRLYTVAGRTGAGKTVFGIQCLRSFCEAGANVGYASIEMGASDLGDRLAATYGVPYSEIRTGHVQGSNAETMRAALDKIRAMRFDVIDRPTLRAAQLWTIQRLRRYDALIVDHLHRIRVSGGDGHRVALEDEVRTFTTLAREENIPVVLLAQLRRPDQQRGQNARPLLEDLRETEVIAQESALVLGIWIDRDGQTNMPTGDAELLVLKNRFGGLGKMYLDFDGATVRFDAKRP